MAKRLQKPKPQRNTRRYQQRGLLTLTGAFSINSPDLTRDIIPKFTDTPIEPRTQAQADLIEAIDSHVCTFATGPAGTGKTYLAAALAAKALMDGDVDRIVITRPAVEAGEELGFLPGDLAEKYAPYLAPFRVELEKRLGRGQVEMFLKNGRIEPIPLAFMRGRNNDRAFVILDEAQNTTPAQMKMFLTRVGEGSKVMVDGDLKQIDITGPSGLADALSKLSGMPSVAHIEFGIEDIVRSGFVQDVVNRYELGM